MRIFGIDPIPSIYWATIANMDTDIDAFYLKCHDHLLIW